MLQNMTPAEKKAYKAAKKAEKEAKASQRKPRAPRTKAVVVLKSRIQLFKEYVTDQANW